MTESTPHHTALVTGGSRDIGAAIALGIARIGFDVVVVTRKITSQTDVLLSELRETGVQADAHICDVGDAASVETLRSDLERDGRFVDVLVNNASRRHHQAFVDLGEQEWGDVLNVTLGGAFRCARAFAPQMLEQGWGRIVNVIGVRGQTGAVGRAHQVAAKSGLVGLTRALAHELGPRGITVNGVSPGTIVTDRDKADPRRLRDRRHLGVVGRFGTPQDVAGAVAFLVGEESSFVTGQIIGVNGGELMA